MSIICTAPWNAISVTNNGIKLCCNSLVDVEKDDGSRATLEDINSIRTGSFYKKVKDDLLSGVKNTACDRCWNMEPDSFRTHFNRKYKDSYDILCSETPDILPIEHMYIDIGSTCNLNCRMCDPNSSSMIQKEWENNSHPLGHSGSLNVIASDKTTHNTLKDPHFLQFIKDNHKSLKVLYIYGGEPFIILEDHINFLQLLIDLGVSKNISIEYSTNGTNTNKRRFEEIWSKFKSISISISIDGMNECYDYIRWPNTWEKAENSLDYYSNLNKQSDNINVSLACTLQILTASSLSTFRKHIEEKYGFGITFIPVDYPGEFSLKGLPLDVLEKVYDENNDERIRASFKHYIDNYNKSESQKVFEDFLKVSLWQDEYRKQNLYDFFPEIKNWFKE